MIGKVLLVSVCGFCVGGLGLHLASRGVDPSVRGDRRTKFVSYFCIVNAVLLCGFLGKSVVSGLVFLILSAGAYELHRALWTANALQIPMRAGIEAGYAFLSLGLVAFVTASTREMTVFVYLVVAAFDGFSQVAGQLFGKHPLAPTISPGKSVEGALGGAAAAGTMAVLLRTLVRFTVVRSANACFWIVLASLSGDLLASWVKRKCGIKDFGSMLPGQGGVLDRFDSFLFAGPVWFFILILHPWNL